MASESDSFTAIIIQTPSKCPKNSLEAAVYTRSNKKGLHATDVDIERLLHG